MLDTRDLYSPVLSVSLVTRHFVSGGSSRLRRCANVLYLGTSEYIDDSKTNETITWMLQIHDELGDPIEKKFCKVVVVGHGLDHNLSVLRRRGIKLNRLDTIVVILDTEDLAKKMLGTGTALVSLLQTLGCPYEGCSQC